MSIDQTASPSAQTSKLVDLVNYQDGSVVRRVILKQKMGHVSLFALDAGQELSEHTTAFDAMINVLEGEAEVAISGTVTRVNAGEIIIMPPNRPHAVKAIRRFKMMLTIIRS